MRRFGISPEILEPLKELERNIQEYKRFPEDPTILILERRDRNEIKRLDPLFGELIEQLMKAVYIWRDRDILFLPKVTGLEQRMDVLKGWDQRWMVEKIIDEYTRSKDRQQFLNSINDALHSDIEFDPVTTEYMKDILSIAEEMETQQNSIQDTLELVETAFDELIDRLEEEHGIHANQYVVYPS